jgi:phospholipase C
VANHQMKDWEIIAENLSKAGWSWGSNRPQGAESSVDILFTPVRGQTANNGLSLRSFPRDLDRRQKIAGNLVLDTSPRN